MPLSLIFDISLIDYFIRHALAEDLAAITPLIFRRLAADFRRYRHYSSLPLSFHMSFGCRHIFDAVRAFMPCSR
jgi:hypothetical protein